MVEAIQIPAINISNIKLRTEYCLTCASPRTVEEMSPVAKNGRRKCRSCEAKIKLAQASAKRNRNTFPTKRDSGKRMENFGLQSRTN
jgi:hypothetical protein